MKRIILLLLVAAALPAAEIPPFYPPPAAPAPAETAIAPEEVRVTLPGGAELKPGDFCVTRSLNGEWKFSGLSKAERPFPEDPRGFEKNGFDDSTWETIPVPLNWYRKYQDFYEKEKSFVTGCYRHTFELSETELLRRRVLLHFELIGYEGILWINGRRAGRHHGEFVPWTVDVSDFVKPGINQLTMQVNTDFGMVYGTVKQAKHTYGSQWGKSNIKGGIWGDVSLRLEPELRFETIYVVPEFASGSIRLRAKVVNTTGKVRSAALLLAAGSAMKTEPNARAAVSVPVPVVLQPGENLLEGELKLPDPVPWSPQNPYLYYATAALLAEDGSVLTAKPQRFGFREFTIRDGRFHLNGKRIYLFGENISSVDFGGFEGRSTAAEKRELSKRLTGYKSLGYNILRNAHMPILPAALELADEIGIMFYNEWSWSFTRPLAPEFHETNRAELLKWLDRDFNHPSVVMWSCGNEIRHAGDPAIRRELDHQVGLMHRYDLQHRPVSSFSGAANWRNYGSEKLLTDFLDHHSYVGMTHLAWTSWFENFNEYYAGSVAQYGGAAGHLKMPYVIWECVGYSWGNHIDRKFRPNDIEMYADYLKRPVSHARLNGAGLIGTLGLAAAVDPARNLDYGKRIYGHRMLELLRQDLRIDGFAPWFNGWKLDAATLWTQPVLIGLRDRGGLPPRNFFSDRPVSCELFTVNSTADSFPGGEAVIRFQLSGERSMEVCRAQVGAVEPFSLLSLPVSFDIPPEARGNVQLRIELLRDGGSVSRNFYPVFVADAAALARPIRSERRVALLDTGSPADVKRTSGVLTKYGVKHRVINANSVPDEFDFAVVPAAVENRGALKWNREALFDWIDRGGTLLMFEQKAESGSLFGETTLLHTPNTFVDLIHPAHPAFAGLTPRNFDTWVNPDHGYPITVSLNPFMKNALAARGPMAGQTGVTNAVLEATFGKGRIFWSQLNLVTLHDLDGVAATCLRNVLDYLLNGERYGRILPLDPALSRSSEVNPENLESIDLRACVNRGFSDDRDNDGRGGWTDQGRNDFRNMPLGRQIAAGIPFEIIDPESNGGRSCVVLRGSERRAFPSEVTGIRIGGNFTRLFFLHAAAWCSGDCGIYRIHYEDGGSCDVLLKAGVNIGDWWSTSYLSEAAPGIMRPNATKSQVGTYVACWENPHPEKKIATLDFLSMESPLVTAIDFQPGKVPVPILVAVTGERFHSAPVRLREKVVAGGANPAAQGTAARIRTTLPDGTDGEAYRIELPAPDRGIPHVMVAFPRAWEGKRLGDYNYLTFWYKVEEPGAVDLRLPESDWKGYLAVSMELRSPQWRKARIDLRRIGGEAFIREKKNLRGELFFFNGKNRDFRNPRPTVRFLVTDLMLE